VRNQLTGKTALVTGGSRGIGAGIVRRLALEGAQVAFTYVKAEDKAEEMVKEVAGAGGHAVAIRADSADPTAVRAAIADTVRTLGGLNILVNNSAFDGSGSIETSSLDDFDNTVAVNLRGAYVAIQGALQYMGTGDRIINIGSIFADRTPAEGNGDSAVYQMTKAGIAGLTRGLARELGPRGITANTVQPGIISTSPSPQAVEYTKIMVAQTPVGRAGLPSEIAAAVAYLASPEASFVNGATWNVDGGFAV
jgi:3-oxoacyl-[acyl-carrier protein] reductase